YSDGVQFSVTTTLATEGAWQYQFQAQDGGPDATDAPAANWPRAGVPAAAAQTEPMVNTANVNVAIDDAPKVSEAAANNTTLFVTFQEFGTMNSGTVEAGANYTLENPTGTPLGTLAGLTGFYDGATKIVTFFPLPWTLTSLAPNN
ncbi:MAG: hypothetical protein COZ57_19640, partial [Armatimonadetes bacterium CG_4_8_14_3_um_filter_66_20]